METRTLPHTGLTVSRACFGAMAFGGQTDEPTAARIVERCIETGINFFDTANNYSGGRSEEILGGILKGRRHHYIVATKVGNVTGKPPGAPPLSKVGIEASIEDSLRRLQTDYIDLYYLHLPDYTAPIEETLDTMNAQVKAGKVRYFATSNYAAWQVAQMFGIAAQRGYPPPHTSQPMYNLLARGIEQEYVPFCKEFGVSMIVYNPLAGGLLTGKQQRDRPVAGSRFDNNRMYLDRYWHPAYFDAVDELQRIGDTAGRSLIDLALNWLLFHTPTDCILLGASKLDQLEQNLAVFGKATLSAETVAALDQVWNGLRGVTPKYNR